MAIDIATIGSSALNIVIMIISIIIVGGIMGGATFLIIKYRRYKQFICIIFERDGFGQLHRKIDDAGIFVDGKTKNKRFFMKRMKVGLNADNIPYIQSGTKKIVYLLKTGLKNFRYIKMSIQEPKVLLTVGEEDVNWALNTYERNKVMWKGSMWMQLMPYIAIAFVTIIILIIFIYFFKEFASLKEFAIVMKETAQILLQSQTGTVVLGG